jgi:hypothetical protein
MLSLAGSRVQYRKCWAAEPEPWSRCPLFKNRPTDFELPEAVLEVAVQ